MSVAGIVRRSQLVTPAKSVATIAKALALPCDSLVVDLEDAIAPAMKVQARQVLREALSDAPRDGKEIGVRINGLDSPWFLDDLLALEGLPIDAVVVPKIHCAQDVYTVDRMLEQLERRGGRAGVAMLPLIESARGVLEADAIATASPRCSALIFGAGDFRADTGVAFTRNGLAHARGRIVLAAAAAGLQALDCVFPRYDDVDGLEQSALDGKEMGFSGKWAIHPRQVPVIERVFSPSAAEIEQARALIAGYEAALAAGQGAVTVDGAMVDEASLKVARRRAALADRLGA